MREPVLLPVEEPMFLSPVCAERGVVVYKAVVGGRSRSWDKGSCCRSREYEVEARAGTGVGTEVSYNQK